MKRKLITLILVLTMVLSMAQPAFADDAFNASRFTGIYVDKEVFLMADSFNKVIWSYTKDQGWVKLAGAYGPADASGEPSGAYTDGLLSDAHFVSPRDISPFMKGYAVSDSAANAVRFIEGEKVRTLLGPEIGLKNPTGLATDEDGVLYISDTNNGRIVRLEEDGSTRVYCAGLVDPTGLSYREGKLYVCETGKNRIIEIDCETEKAEVYCGKAIEDGAEYLGEYINGSLNAARFNHPQGILASEDGNIYIADTGNMAIRVISEGRVYTVIDCEDTYQTMTHPVDLAEYGSAVYIADDTSYESLAFAKASGYGASAVNHGFIDIPQGSWYEAAAAKAKSYGFVSGVTQTTFGGDSPITRAQYVTMLSGVLKYFDGTTVVGGDAQFPDNPDSAWYAKYVRWAADEGLMSGIYIDGELCACPDRTLTREQLAVMLKAFAEKNDFALKDAKDLSPAEYSDGADVSSWAGEAMAWALQKDILGGYTDGSLRPQEAVTRAQATVILSNFVEKVQ